MEEPAVGRAPAVGERELVVVEGAFVGIAVAAGIVVAAGIEDQVAGTVQDELLEGPVAAGAFEAAVVVAGAFGVAGIGLVGRFVVAGKDKVVRQEG